MPSRRSRRRSPSVDSDTETRKLLPPRSSRGSRINKLIGEEAEADASFWGQAAWQEDGEDDDYSTEAEEEDVVDSDFDQEEAPDDDIHDKEEDEEPTRRKRPATSSGRYKEPLQSRPAKRKAVVSVVKSPVAFYEYVAPIVRSSTAKKSSDSSEMRRRASYEAAKLAVKNKKPTVEKTGNQLTQAQLLAEAVRTEVENIQSLQRLEQLEEEKKAESSAPKAPFTGSLVRYYSKLGAPKTITFLNTLEFPAIFNQSKPKKRISSHELKIARKQEEDNESGEDDDVEEKTDVLVPTNTPKTTV